MSRDIGLVIKRIVDIVVAFAVLISCFPVLIVVALAIRIRLGQPVVFRQLRPGYKGQPFYVYKFRTMMRSNVREDRQLSDAERMGRLGKLLRKTSLDELPQLINVLRGEMSLVGPRPLLMEYLPLYSLEQMRRHDLRPGITGLAQVNGRNTLEWDRRFELDVWYVDNWSLYLDFKIGLISILKAIRGSDVKASGIGRVGRFNADREGQA